ncbi:MAG: HEAT repeat domain-containing protein [Methanobrevibacter ruminantium]|uniref:HEAT repeat domain-containing protein n=1 Tax=Methanobrevibacter ruminantium TaxID=83816 RepID=UPI0026F0A280|nr:HEAT repeat domain-containing protein [Methanobrevibacter ruminantium]MDO5843010.1 HEAT repeat domain-containing protein [Methanobrevibacter ruminantium]
MRTITKDKESWKANVDFVALKLNEDYSVAVKAKALWLLGEMGLKYPEEIEPHINDIAGYLENDESKLRERSANAIGRIGRADKDLIIDYIDTLMKLKYDKTENVRHAFIWACENIAANAPELFCEKLDIFYEMITDSHEKLRIEAPEMFRVIGKRNPNCVKPYLEKLEYIAENDENQTVRIHSAGAIRITKKALEEI